MNRVLYYGDNLPILKSHIQDESVDLIYLDPPFNSKANYNVLFEEKSGKDSIAQVEAFEDTWHWTEDAEKTFLEIVQTAPADVVDMISAFRKFIKRNDMLAYLVMMTVRLVELKRVLKPNGSIYLHCDPTASHYLKVVMDTIFGVRNFRNEIVWQRTNAHNMKTNSFVRANDIILYYAKSDIFTFHEQYTDYSPEQLKRFKPDAEGRLYKAENLTFSNPNKNRQFEWRGTKPPANRSWGMSIDELERLYLEGKILLKKDGKPRLDGLKVYLDETKGKPLTTNWTDIDRIGNTARERLGYPTQKPRTLLERIIKASAGKDFVVLDPFCGCGTTISACESLNKNEGYHLSWIGIDITHLAINLIKGRLYGEYNLDPKKDYQVMGEPKDLEGAVSLSEQDRYQFQWWALSLVNARPYGDKKKGSDKGIDGYIYFMNYTDNKTEKAIVQVKSGKVKSGDVRDLKGVVEREEAAFGLFLTLQNPTKDMLEESASSGFWKDRTEYPKIQIYTIESLLNDAKVKIPNQVYHSKEAEKVGKKDNTKNLF